MDATMDKSQKEIPIFHVVGDLKLFSDTELQLAKTYADALYLTWKLSGKPRKVIEADADIAPETLSRMFSGTRGIPPGKEFKFFEACGNAFALQWQVWSFGFRTSKRDLTVEEKAALYDQQQLMERSA